MPEPCRMMIGREPPTVRDVDCGAAPGFACAGRMRYLTHAATPPPSSRAGRPAVRRCWPAAATSRR
jgi:hypothetical protein